MSNDCYNGEVEKEPVRYAASLPYPSACVRQKNPFYARMMLDNVGGSNSEMSAVSLYIYNNMITGMTADIAESFHHVSIVEMHHLNIFGDLALKLGENPRLWTYKGNRMTYWTPGYNNYPTELKPLLVNVINGEKNAVRKYEQQIRQIKDPDIADILQRIIMDEELHICIFEELYHKYC